MTASDAQALAPPAIRLSFIMATAGERPSIARALRSIIAQPLAAGDEIILVGNLAPVWRHIPPGPYKPIVCGPFGDWGYTERNLGLKHATGTHIVVVDDDDALLPGAVEAIRGAIGTNPGRPIMFRMVEPHGLVIWLDKEVREGNHGGPQFVCPNVPDRLGTFSSRYEGDFDFCVSTLGKYPEGEGALVWDSAVIYGCREFGNLGWGRGW